MLPIASALPALKAALQASNLVILSAPPGSGKTTAVPLALLNEDWLGGKMVMLEPRRIAARGAASYMASTLNESVGETVGYQVRHERNIGSNTKLEIVTEGLLTRRLQSDPELASYDLVIFDEFHERHLQTDLALALCHDCQQGLRDDLKILIMSATLDVAALQRQFPDAPVVQAEGRSFPVDIHWGQRCEKREIAQATANTVKKALQEQQGDVLVFLPGRAEIQRCAEQLSSLENAELKILPLSADTPAAQQRNILRQQTYRRVILSTALAESSVTIEGITTVVDSGWSRLPSFDANRGFTGLETLRTSRASATQRAGRAGRLGPGHCYRLWSENEQQALAAQNAAEILQADLAPLMLELGAWGVNEFEQLTWLDKPPAGHIAQAQSLLRKLGALDAQQRLTPHGQALNRFGLHPRLATMLLKADGNSEKALAAECAALLNDGSSNRDSDISQRLRAPSSAAKRSAKQLKQQLKLSATTIDTDDAGAVLLAAFPDRIAKQQGRSGEQVRYKLSNGAQAFLPIEEVLAQQEWLVVCELQPQREGNRIRLAAAVTERDINQRFADELTPRSITSWDKQQGCVLNETQIRLGELILDRQATNGQGDVLPALCDGIRHTGWHCLPHSKETDSLLARLRWLQQNQSDWPDFSERYLLEHLENWLGPWLDGKTRLKQLADVALKDALLNHLGYERKAELEALAPSHLAVPTGSNIRIDYSRDIPTLAVRVQEMFGASQTPTVLNGQVPVKLELLSPGHKPIAVTQDLPSFWQGAWLEVKKEMKGRYPKHVWPDDPANTEPTNRTKKGYAIRPR
jgi:ATP-dependent helicase HrpB